MATTDNFNSLPLAMRKFEATENNDDKEEECEEKDDKGSPLLPNASIDNKTDGASERTKEVDIIMFIHLDDGEGIKTAIESENGESKLYQSICDAVDLNSLACLKYLLEKYSRHLCELSTPENEMRNNRFGIDSQIGFKMAKQYPLHVIASRCSDMKALDLVEKCQIFMEDHIDMADNEGSTPLLIAIKRRNNKVAKRLLNYRPDITKKNKDEESPIMLAALTGQTDILMEMKNEYLDSEFYAILEKNSDLYGKDHSILYAASKSKNPDILDALMKFGNANVLLATEKKADKKEWGIFVCNICESGCSNLLQEILEFTDTPMHVDELEDENGATPLMRAAEAGRQKIVEMLLKNENGKNLIPKTDFNRRNVFHYAVKSPTVLENLISHPVTIINETDNNGNTPLQLAAMEDSTKSFEILLKHVEKSKDDLFSRPYVGYTNLEILKLVLENWEKDDPQAVKDFLQGDNEYQPLIQAAAKGDIEMMKYLINEKCANKMQKSFDDSTALHYAVIADKFPAVEFLIKECPELIDCTNDCGETAAGAAIILGNPKILRFLLEKRAQITTDNSDRTNILDCAYGYFKKAEDSVKEIIDFCEKDSNPDKLKQLIKDSRFDPDQLMSKMVEEIPSAAIHILDQCITRETDLRNRSYSKMVVERKITYDFYPFQKKSSDGRLKAIESMVNFKRDDCLAHPVVVKFLNEKLSCSNVNKWLAINFVLYLIFLLCLTAYVGLQTQGFYSLKSPGLIILSIAVIIVSGLNIIKEIVQAKFNYKEYFCSIDNYIEWIIYVCAIVYVTQSGDMKRNWQIAAGAISVFLGWINFIWFLKRYSLLGIYIIMASKVFMSVLKVLPMVVLFIIAFSMAFSLLMPGKQGFTSIPTSFLTTFVMMTGEMDYRGTFLGESVAILSAVQRLFFIVFLLVITVAIMNLLTGLAVGDTNEIMKRSKQEKRLYKASLVIALERTLLGFTYFSLPTLDGILKYYPDRKKEMESRLVRFWRHIYNDDQLDEEKEVSLEEVEVELKTLTELCENHEEKRDEQFNCLNETIVDIRETNERKGKVVETHLENLLDISESKTKSIQGYLTSLKETCEAKGNNTEKQLNILKDFHEKTEKNIEAKLENLTSTLEASDKTAQQQLETLTVAFATRERNAEKQLQQLSEISEKRGEKIENELKSMEVVLERLEKNVEEFINPTSTRILSSTLLADKESSPDPIEPSICSPEEEKQTTSNVFLKLPVAEGTMTLIASILREPKFPDLLTFTDLKDCPVKIFSKDTTDGNKVLGCIPIRSYEGLFNPKAGKKEKRKLNKKIAVEIIIAIHRDDSKGLLKIFSYDVGKLSIISTIHQRIFEAVEYNSLKCLKELLTIYEKLRESDYSYDGIGQIEIDKPLRYRKFGHNWFNDEDPKESSLHVVASRCSAIRAMQIIEKYPNFMHYHVDATDEHGSTPLLIAVKRNNVDVAKHLLNYEVKRANITKTNKSNESPIYLAALNGRVEILKEMLKLYPSAAERRKIFDESSNLYGTGHSILYPASQSKSLDVLNDLMEEEVVIALLKAETKTNEWGSFVCNVCETGCTKLLKEILEFNASTTDGVCRDENKATPLMRATNARNVEIIEMLLKSEIGRNTFLLTDKKGRNVFHYAVKYPDVLRVILKDNDLVNENKTAITKEDNNGYTPLHVAAINRYIESFKMLLPLVNIKDDLFLHPFVGYTNLEILKLVMENWEERDSEAVKSFLHGDGDCKPLIHVTSKGNLEMIEILIEKCVNGEQRSLDDSTALHHAAKVGNVFCADVLIKNFPNIINYINNSGETAAGWATKFGNVDILKILLKNGAKITGDKISGRVNILDGAFEDFSNAERTVKKIIKYCDRGDSQCNLKQLMEDSRFGPYRLLSKMVEYNPAAAIAVLDKFVERKMDSNSSPYPGIVAQEKVIFDFLPFKEKQPNGKLESIESMIEFKRDDCLAHPIVVKFLNKKLHSSGANWWLKFNIFLYVLFLIMFTIYVGLQSKGSFKLKSPGFIALSFVIIIVCLFNMGKEIMQAIFDWKEYSRHIENYFEWIIYIFAIVYVMQIGNQKYNLQIAAGGIAILFAWFDFIWFLKRYSLLGIYILMANKVFITLFKVLPMVVFFIIPFTMTFTLLMSKEKGFTSTTTSFFTMFDMMVGEVDYKEVFLDNSESDFYTFQRLLLILFLILNTVAIMNLLTGLAVGDTNEIMKKSKSEKRLYKAGLVIKMERYLNTLFLKSAPKFKSNLDENPTKGQNSPWSSWLSTLFANIYKNDAMNEKNYVSLEKVKGRCKNLLDVTESQEKDFELEFRFLKRELGIIFKDEHGDMIKRKLKTLLEVSESNLRSIEDKAWNLYNTFEYIEVNIENELRNLEETYNETNEKIQQQLEKIESAYESRQTDIHVELENLIEASKTKEKVSQELLVALTNRNDATEERILECTSRIMQLLEKLEQNWGKIVKL